MLSFLDTLLKKREDSSLDVTVYSEPTHTDRYLDFQSHHPPHVQRGHIRGLYNRVRAITSAQDNLQKEEHHLSMVLRLNYYSGAFIHSAAGPHQREEGPLDLPPKRSSPHLVVLPYTAGVSEDIRRVCMKYGMKVVFKAGWSLRSVLTKGKDPLPMEKKAKLVYQILYSCGKSYIGETRRRLETRLREHQEACWKGTMEKSAVAEHAWKDHHAIKWDETTVVDLTRHPRELLLKEAIHIQMTPAEECLNRDTGLELPGCWVAALRRQEDSTN